MVMHPPNLHLHRPFERTFRYHGQVKRQYSDNRYHQVHGYLQGRLLMSYVGNHYRNTVYVQQGQSHVLILALLLAVSRFCFEFVLLSFLEYLVLRSEQPAFLQSVQADTHSDQ